MTKRSADIDKLYYGRPMSCAVCRACFEMVECPGRCIYGGPYVGYRMSDGTTEVLE